MRDPWVSVGGFVWMLTLLGARVTLCRETPDDFVTQWKSECHFLNGTERVRYVARWSYNQQQFLHFDSDTGVFKADDLLGVPSAESLNSQKEVLEQERAAVDTFCRHNYGILEDFMQRRRVKPKVKVSRSNNEDPNKPHMLICNVNGFYPYAITVHWYKNGQKDPGVLSSELLQNGDWTGQVMVMLETSINPGDTFVCEVLHVSLDEPLRRNWDSEESESAKSKKLTGIIGLVLGGLFFTVGGVMYWKNKKGRPQFHLQPEGVNFMG
ncbi:H-2 class II histocompatibility antigen, E-S beta chain-like [Ambystoma mexicanum]|uniref:MHC class II beta chain n=4 Tax=Ambystoma mexicanum TaxID=8296 RepID=Q9GIP9_AMBME|nr:MHC class II beta chain [Ambystoma mexicanum]